MSKYINNEIQITLNSSWVKIIELIPINSNVLDVGCSSGYLGKELISLKNCKVSGIDMAEEDIKKASLICDKAIVGDVEDYRWIDEFKEGSFDIIVFADVLEHLREPFELIKQVRSLLKKEGYIIISVPNIAHSSVRLSLLRGKFESQSQGIMDNTHLQYFTRDKIAELIICAGFKIDSINPIIVNQIPSKIIAGELQELGLTASQKFFDIFNTEEANAYQYVIKAKITDIEPHDIQYPEQTEIQIKADQYIHELNTAFKELQSQVVQRDSVIKGLTVQIEERDSVIKSSMKQIEERDSVIKRLGNQVEERDSVIKRLGNQVEERDSIIKINRNEINEYDKQLKLCISQRENLNDRLRDTLNKVIMVKEELKSIKDNKVYKFMKKLKIL